MVTIFILYKHCTDKMKAEAVRATIWATAEPGTGIIAASIAILRPLLRLFTTTVRTQVSKHGSRKASLGGSTLNQDDDTIELNSSFGTKTSIYATHAEDPWSPTVVVGKAIPQRVTSVQMVAGRGSPVPSVRPPPPISKH
jgi:hypothetical protein